MCEDETIINLLHGHDSDLQVVAQGFLGGASKTRPDLFASHYSLTSTMDSSFNLEDVRVFSQPCMQYT